MELDEGDGRALPRDLDPGDVAVEAEEAVQRPARRDGRRDVAHHQDSGEEREKISINTQMGHLKRRHQSVACPLVCMSVCVYKVAQYQYFDGVQK